MDYETINLPRGEEFNGLRKRECYESWNQGIIREYWRWWRWIWRRFSSCCHRGGCWRNWFLKQSHCWTHHLIHNLSVTQKHDNNNNDYNFVFLDTPPKSLDNFMFNSYILYTFHKKVPIIPNKSINQSINAGRFLNKEWKE